MSKSKKCHSLIDDEYLEFLHHLTQQPERLNTRTGLKTKSCFFNFIHYPLAKGFPLISARPTPLRWIFEETMFFLRGQTDTKILEDKGITIWKGNSSREFLDHTGHSEWPDGEIGPGSYGALWRDFPSADRFNRAGSDQLQDLVEGLKNDPYGRRHLITAWHPDESMTNAALPACHILQQYYVTADGELESLFYMRSNDVLFGFPFNIAQYALINIFIAKLVGLKPGKITYVGGDVHIYENQYDMVDELLQQSHDLGVAETPTLTINKELNTLDDLLALEFEDLELTDYNPNPAMKNKPPMAV